MQIQHSIKDRSHSGFYSISLCDPFTSVSALKPEEMPEVRMETDERQSAGYEVYHQKLVITDVFRHGL